MTHRSLDPVEEQMLFLQEHSTAITQFANLEQQLAELVAAGMVGDARRAAYTAFFGIEAFRSKLEFVDRFVRVLVKDTPELIDQWSKVHERCKRSSEGRNRLVHWRVVHHLGGKPGLRTILVPPSFNPVSKFADEPDWRSGTEPPSYALGVRQIVEIRYGFFDAFIMLERFKASAAGMETPCPDVQLPALPPTLAQLTSDFRAQWKRGSCE